MKAFRAPMLEMGEVEAILEALPKNRGVLQVIGTIDAQKAQLIDTLGADSACRLTGEKLKDLSGSGEKCPILWIRKYRKIEGKDQV